MYLKVTLSLLTLVGAVIAMELMSLARLASKQYPLSTAAEAGPGAPQNAHPLS